jgi:hypothetical protein
MVVAGPAEGYYRIDHDVVPGIGPVGTVLPSNTKVHPPGSIPDAKPVTAQQLNKQMRRESQLNTRVKPGPDIGPVEEVAHVQRQAGSDLFLRKVAVSCNPIPRAALWVYSYVHASPGRRPYLNSLEASREAEGDTPRGCEPARLRIDRWQGVRIDPKNSNRARTMLRGAVEVERHGSWHNTDQRIWKLALRREDNRWRIAIDYERFSDDSGEP